MTDIPIFIINLPTARERRAAIARQLDALHLPHQFIEAVNGAALDLETCADYDGRKRRLFFGRDLTKGELGCLLSHRAIYQKMVAEKIPVALVLEDDCLVGKDLSEILQTLLTFPVGWDIIRFLGKEKDYRKNPVLGKLCGTYNLTRVVGTPGGAYGYVLTLAGAQKMLRHMQKNWLPVDTLQGHVVRLGLKTFAVAPSPITHALEEGDKSLIGHTRFDKTRTSTGWEGAVYPATRFGYKLYDACQKQMAQMLAAFSDERIKKRLGA